MRLLETACLLLVLPSVALGGTLASAAEVAPDPREGDGSSEAADEEQQPE